MTSCEWAAAVTAIALAIAKGRTPAEVEYIALLFSQLAATLSTIAATPPGLNLTGGGGS